MNYGIILAAGKSKRFKDEEKKQFIKINNNKVLYYSIDKFLQSKLFYKIILILDRCDIDTNNFYEIIKKYDKELTEQKIMIVFGGKERYDSVYKGLSFIKDCYNIKPIDNIIIHDSARPNVDMKDTKKLISALKKYKAVSLSYKLNDSIKEVITRKNINEIVKTIDRDKYNLVSTPQGFKIDLLYNCYTKFYNDKRKKKVTDDLQIVELYSKEKTYLLDSNPLNIKITKKVDIELFKQILK